MPDFGKMLFNTFPAKPWPDILPNVDDHVVHLVQNMVVCSQHKRLRADEVGVHQTSSNVCVLN